MIEKSDEELLFKGERAVECFTDQFLDDYLKSSKFRLTM